MWIWLRSPMPMPKSGYRPADRWGEFKAQAWAAYIAASPALAALLREQLVSTWQPLLPTAINCFLDDFSACTAHLHLPLAHRQATRTTNLLERLFGEERRAPRPYRMPSASGRC